MVLIAFIDRCDYNVVRNYICEGNDRPNRPPKFILVEELYEEAVNVEACASLLSKEIKLVVVRSHKIIFRDLIWPRLSSPPHLRLYLSTIYKSSANFGTFNFPNYLISLVDSHLAKASTLF